MIKPAWEDNEQARFGPHSDRRSIGIARRSYGVHARAWIKKLQYAAKGVVRLVVSSIDVIDT